MNENVTWIQAMSEGIGVDLIPKDPKERLQRVRPVRANTTRKVLLVVGGRNRLETQVDWGHRTGGSNSVRNSE